MRRLVATALVAGVFAVLPVAPASAAATIVVAGVDGAISSTRPVTRAVLNLDQPAEVSVDHHLESDGAPITPVSHAEGPTNADQQFWFDVTADGLPEGTYALAGDATMRTSDGTEITQPLPPMAVTVDRTGPTASSVDPYVTVIRPGSITDANTSTLVTAHGDAASGDSFGLFNSAGQFVGRLPTTVELTTGWWTQWDGHGSGGIELPAGLYTFKLGDEAGNYTDIGVQVRLQRLVTKTWSREVTARDSKVRAYVGGCSTLRSPSRRGWAGSLGYYSGVRCRTGDEEWNVVSTRHRVALPRGVEYHDLTMSIYGGAATSRPKSVLRTYPGPAPLSLAAGQVVGPRLRWHTPKELSAHVVRRDGVSYAVWQVGTRHRNRYDVKKFRITFHHQVWQ